MPKGTLYLIPSVIAEDSTDTISTEVVNLLPSLDYFLVEHERTARRFLRKVGYKKDFDEGVMERLDKKTDSKLINEYLQPILQGKDAGVLSEAGCPGIADPGSKLVKLAHKAGIRVKPLTGPSSIFLALMGSGMNGQAFTFHGYIPIKDPKRKQAIQSIEQQAIKFGYTQIFMETPYRNSALAEELVKNLSPHMSLCIASNITAPDENIETRLIKDWKGQLPDIHKIPTIFLLSR